MQSFRMKDANLRFLFEWILLGQNASNAFIPIGYSGAWKAAESGLNSWIIPIYSPLCGKKISQFFNSVSGENLL